MKAFYGFDFDNYFKIHDTFIIGIFGKRRVGKSNVIKYLLKKHLYKKFDEDNIYLIKDTNYDVENYDKVMDIDNIYPFKPQFVFNLVLAQKELIKEGKDKPLLIIFDDCMLHDKLNKSSIILEDIMFNSAHFNCSVIFSSQYMAMLKSAYISQMQLVIIKNVMNFNFLENIRKSFVPYISSTQFMKAVKYVFNVKYNKYINLIFDADDHEIYIQDIGEMEFKKKKKLLDFII